MKTVVAVFGYKKSGKTHLIERLVKEVSNLGYRVSVIKHIHHGDFDVDIEGKDTWRFLRAGAVGVSGISRLRLYLNIRINEYPDIDEIIETLGKYSDIIFIEGLKNILGHRTDIYKIAVGDKDLLKTLSEPILGFYGGEGDLQKIMEKLIDIVSSTP
jgi:molybdopterin-guanine dinucleotide biosynthesis protein B